MAAPKPIDVAVLVGSLRRDSYSRKIARALGEVAPAPLRLLELELRHLAFYNEDEDVNPPRPWREFRARIDSARAVLFVTPEYNRSMPGVVKNAIDVGSRPVEASVWNGKPAGIICVAPGTLVVDSACQHLRQSLEHLNVLTMPQPPAYLAGIDQVFDLDGHLRCEATRECLRHYLEALLDWIGSHRHGESRRPLAELGFVEQVIEFGRLVEIRPGARAADRRVR